MYEIPPDVVAVYAVPAAIPAATTESREEGSTTFETYRNVLLG
jgi:hypothetical protein